MALDDIVVPAIIQFFQPMITSGLFGDIKFGEQLQVAQPPELWIIPANGQFPEKEGSELEQTDWNFDFKMLYPYANDQKACEDVLAALIEPVRQKFRSHLKLGHPQQIARARALGVTMAWTVVNADVYRSYTIRVAVREKIPVSFSA